MRQTACFYAFKDAHEMTFVVQNILCLFPFQLTLVSILG